MKEYIDSKENLLSVIPKHKNILYVLITTIILFIIFISTFKYYDIYMTKLIVKNDKTYILSGIKDTSKIIKSKYIKIDDKLIKFKLVEVSEIYYDNYLNNYQEILIKTDKKLKNNLVMDVKLYQNKETIIKKIYRLIR